MQHSASSPALLALGMIGPFLFGAASTTRRRWTQKRNVTPSSGSPQPCNMGVWIHAPLLTSAGYRDPTYLQYPWLSSSSKSTSGCTWARAILSTAGQPTFLSSVHQTSCYGVTWRGYRTRGAYKILTQMRRSVGAAARAGSVNTCRKQ